MKLGENEFLLNKGERTRRRILEAAIESISLYGFEGTSVTTICKLAAANRGLVVHYFSTMDKLYKETNLHVLNFVVQYTTAYMTTEISTPDLVDRYLKVTFDWIDLKPMYGHYLVLLVARTPHDKNAKKIIETLFNGGRQRLCELIKARGAHAKASKADIERLARQIHSALVGSLMYYLIDKNNFDSSKEMIRITAAKILKSKTR